jgi:hypothetical protein
VETRVLHTINNNDVQKDLGLEIVCNWECILKKHWGSESVGQPVSKSPSSPFQEAHTVMVSNKILSNLKHKGFYNHTVPLTAVEFEKFLPPTGDG